MARPNSRFFLKNHRFIPIRKTGRLRSREAKAPVLDVLIVDDSAAIRKILQRVLRQTEMPIGTVYEAGDGVEALETLRKQTVGLVLSDINMPNMDGLEFLTKVRAEQAWQKLPDLMVSTEGTQAKVLEAVERGASGYVRKPFTAEQIKEKLVGLDLETAS